MSPVVHEEAKWLSWSDRPGRELVRLSWPIAVSMLSYSLMSLVDTMFVGHMGSAALAGVGLGAVLSLSTLVFGIGLVRGAKTLISQAMGAGRPEEYGPYLGASMLLGLLYSVLALLAAQGIAWWLGAGNADPAHHQASIYMHVRSCGAPFVLLYMAIREARYGKGDARSPMVATLIANLANIALNVLFVIVLRMGVFGSALATALAHGIEALALVVVQWREGFGVRGLTRAHVRALRDVGVPSGLQFALEVGAFALLASIVSMTGAVNMAAHQIALNLIHVSFLPAFALGEAAAVLTGNAVGARRSDLIHVVAKSAVLLAGAYTGACTILFIAFARVIGRVFTDEVPVQQLVATLMIIAACFQVADAANMVARGVLRGAGDVRVPALIGVVTAWVMSPPLAWLLGVTWHMGAVGAWIGLTGEIFLGAGVLWWRLLRSKFRAQLVLAASDPEPIAAE